MRIKLAGVIAELGQERKAQGSRDKFRDVVVHSSLYDEFGSPVSTKPYCLTAKNLDKKLVEGVEVVIEAQVLSRKNKSDEGKEYWNTQLFIKTIEDKSTEK